MIKNKKYLLKTLTYIIAIVLPYIFVYNIHNFHRNLYRSEFYGDEIIKINLKSDYHSVPSFIILRNKKPLEFYYVFENDGLFEEKVRVGDKVCKASGTFDFIVTHTNGTSDTLFRKPPWEFKFLNMPQRKVFKNNCP